MAYLVLVFGLVMGVLGALAIANGYPVIEIERGWAAVIAGSTMLAGGVVTCALGLVLRALGQLRKSMAPSLAAASRQISHATVERTADETDLPQAIVVATATDPVPLELDLLPVPHEDVAPSRSSGEVEVLSSAAAVGAYDEAHDGHDTADRYALQTPSTSEHDLVAGGPALDDWLDRAFSDIDRGLAGGGQTPALRTPAAALEPQIVPPEPAFDDPVRRHEPVDEEHHVDGAHSEAIQAEVHHAEASHAEDLAHEPALEGAEHSQDALPGAEASESARGREPGHDDAADHATEVSDHPADVLLASEPEPAAAAPLAQAHPEIAAAAPESAVIGRYEAEGTIYTMYADGSIEAQSSAGIYRFASMAELKSFIEG